jgi:hexokinase
MKRAGNIKGIEKLFRVSLSDMKNIAGDFRDDMDNAMSGKKSSLKMIRTYAYKPTGKEKGRFIALDLGGTNFRILEISLDGSSHARPSGMMMFRLDKKHIVGRGEEFFDFIADSLKTFLKKSGELGRERKLGFTFSFPVKQTGIASGKLVCWTKGFKVSGVIDKDVVTLLEEALIRNDVPGVKVSALVNDTVGTLQSGGYGDRHCDLGVIIGTGTNACYAEPSLGGMIINTEWGNFNKIKVTIFDKFLDASSDNPGSQILEKTISGMYLGRLASAVLKAHIFPGIRDLKTEEMSGIESDRSKGRYKTKKILADAGVKTAAPEDIAACRNICSLVSLRAARFTAACLSAIITRIDPAVALRHSIAIDGSVYEKHPKFKNNMNAALKEIFGKKSKNIKTVMAKDGSGKGAAITAAAAG